MYMASPDDAITHIKCSFKVQPPKGTGWSTCINYIPGATLLIHHAWCACRTGFTLHHHAPLFPDDQVDWSIGGFDRGQATHPCQFLHPRRPPSLDDAIQSWLNGRRRGGPISDTGKQGTSSFREQEEPGITEEGEGDRRGRGRWRDMGVHRSKSKTKKKDHQ